jgi:arginine decarboxylase
MSKEPSLSNVLVAASLRTDQWRQLNAAARAWASAGDSARASARDACARLFDTATRLEYCWAYPGERLLAALRNALDGADAALFARLVQKVSGALLSGDYRRDEAVWDTADAADRAVLDALPPDVTGTPDKPYFEVLVVTPGDPSQWLRAKEEMRRMRRVDDAFQYSTVHVGSLEDALLAVMVNLDLQAVILIDGFGFASRHDVPDL